jgi:hypothetical protein
MLPLMEGNAFQLSRATKEKVETQEYASNVFLHGRFSLFKKTLWNFYTFCTEFLENHIGI